MSTTLNQIRSDEPLTNSSGPGLDINFVADKHSVGSRGITGTGAKKGTGNGGTGSGHGTGTTGTGAKKTAGHIKKTINCWKVRAASMNRWIGVMAAWLALNFAKKYAQPELEYDGLGIS